MKSLKGFPLPTHVPIRYTCTQADRLYVHVHVCNIPRPGSRSIGVFANR